MTAAALRFVLFLLLAGSWLLSSCRPEEACITGSGALQNQTMPVNAVRGVLLLTDADLELRIGPEPKLTAKGEPNVLERVQLREANGLLEIGLKGCVKRQDSLAFVLTLPYVRYVRNAGNGMLSCRDTLRANDLLLELSGPGTLQVKVNSSRIIVHSSSSGSIRLSGQADAEELQMGGDGKVRAFGLEAKACRVQMHGVGEIEVNVQDVLLAEIRGSGKLYYKGNPTLETQIIGAGKIIDLN